MVQFNINVILCFQAQLSRQKYLESHTIVSNIMKEEEKDEKDEEKEMKNLENSVEKEALG